MVELGKSVVSQDGLDPRQEILPRHNRDRVRDVFAAARANGKWADYGDVAVSWQILFPHDKSTLRLNEEVSRGLRHYAEDIGYQGYLPQVLIETLTQFKLLFPQSAEYIDLNRYWGRIIEHLRHQREAAYWEQVIIQTAQAKIIAPLRVDELRLDDDFLAHGQRKLTWFRSNDGEEERSEVAKSKWLPFAGVAAGLRILYPERFDELEIGGSDLQGMRSILSYLSRDPEVGDFLKLAANLKILTAQEVRVTPSGLVVE